MAAIRIEMLGHRTRLWLSHNVRSNPALLPRYQDQAAIKDIVMPRVSLPGLAIFGVIAS